MFLPREDWLLFRESTASWLKPRHFKSVQPKGRRGHGAGDAGRKNAQGFYVCYGSCFEPPKRKI